jgi:type IV pilus assembly protein PilB
LNETVAELLLREKLISPQDLEKAREMVRASGRKLGTVLVEEGMLSRGELAGILLRANKKRDLVDLLIEKKLVVEEDLTHILLMRRGDYRGIGQFLLKKGVISERELASLLAELFGVPLVDQGELAFNEKLVSRLGRKAVEDAKIVPLSEEGKVLTLATADPGNFILFEELSSLLALEIKVRVATASEIDLWLRTHMPSPVQLEKVKRDAEVTLVRDDDNSQRRYGTSLSRTELESPGSPVITMVNSIIYDAVQRRASDIHVEAYDNLVKVKYRIDGVLFTASEEIEPGLQDFLIARVKVMAGLDITEHRVPQDGRFKLLIDGRNVDFRVSTLPTMFGETAAIRILDKLALSLELDSLGFEPAALDRFKTLISRPYGMVLAAGPTGSGKTTTLYASLRHIKRPEDKIITIEDPVEYQLPDIVQIPIDEKKGLTFARGLRSIVRQDPDKIMVGEIRDLETAEIAVNASLTGHLVLSTVHSNNVVDAIGRLLNLGVEPYQLSSATSLIAAQRLVRRICARCLEKHEDRSMEKTIGTSTLARGRGCSYCHESGYFGRTAIFEVLPLSENVKQLVLDGGSPFAIARQAVAEGMIDLRRACIMKVRSHVTTVEEMNRVTFEE